MTDSTEYEQILRAEKKLARVLDVIRRWFDARWLRRHARPGHKTTSWGVAADSMDVPYWTCSCGSRRDVVW